MDKEQAFHGFWSGFDIPAYDVSTVPDDAPFPRITYELTINEFGTPTTIYASIWDKSTSWANITAIAHKIENTLSEGGQMARYDGGTIWLKKGVPFMSRMTDPDDTIRRIIVNVEIEYLEGKR